jgi:hypothetical protein
MVAHTTRRRLPSTELSPADIVRGDVGKGIVQDFTMRYTQLVTDPKTKRSMREWHVTDQFLNDYLVFRAVLSDGDDWDLKQRLKPSELLRYGGFTDELMDAARKKAFHSFELNDREIIKAQKDVYTIITEGSPNG